MQKQYDPEFKERVIRETMETANQSLVARKYDLNKSLVSHWVRNYQRHGSANGLSKKDERKRLLQENQRLKNLLGEKDLEIAILQDLVKKTNRRASRD